MVQHSISRIPGSDLIEVPGTIFLAIFGGHIPLGQTYLVRTCNRFNRFLEFPMTVHYAGWWFGTFFIFPINIWNNHPN